MDQYVYGFWGSFFGVAALTLAGAVFAFARGLRRIAWNAGLAAVASAMFVAAFLGGLPLVGADTLNRVLGLVTSLVAALLFYLLLSILGVLRSPQVRQQVTVGLALMLAVLVAVSGSVRSLQALQLNLAAGLLLAALALGLSLRKAQRGDMLAWMISAGVLCMLLALAGLGWIGLYRGAAPWPVHVFSATAASIYLTLMASSMWMRYHYLIELRDVMAHGPSRDPVTRMRSHSETGVMVSTAFKHHGDGPVSLGMVVVSIGNLRVLQQLYGSAAVNHAWFVCAGRLRRTVPADVDMGRLADDGFLLLVRSHATKETLLDLALAVQACLSRPVVLHTDPVSVATAHQTRWAAEVGVGVRRVWRVDDRSTKAIAHVRSMSRSAWSFPSRVAWYDDEHGEIVGVPQPVG